MDVLSFFKTGLDYAWWFSIVYGMVNIAIILTGSRDSRRRIFTIPKFSSASQKSFFFISMFVLSRGLIIYAIFVPLVMNGFLFYSGIVLSLVSLIFYGLALIEFIKCDNKKPVTTGIYNFVRHPMQFMTFFFWLGAAMAASSVIILLIVFILILLSYPSFKAQERFCIEHFGEQYADYMKRVKRYVLF